MSLAMPREERGHLLRILGLSFGIAVGIGGMIGAGILRTPSLIAAQVPSVWLILGLWALGAVQSALEANVVAELGTALPRAGGFYVYVHRAFGDVGGLVVGWTTWISRLASGSALSVAFADFLALLWPQEAAFKPAVAAGMLVVMFGLNMVGLREGRTFQQTTSFVKGAALVLFCIVAVTLAPRPEVLTAVQMVPVIGWMGALGGYQLILGAYAGWYEPAFFAEETVDPSRSVPRAMGLCILLTGGLYLAVNAALLYALGTSGVAHTALPFAAVLSRLGGTLPATLFAVGAMVTVVSCANAGIMSGPRVLLALSRDRLLPAFVQTVNAGGSPTVAYLMTAIGVIALALSGEFRTLFALIGTLGTLAFTLVIASVFVLRRREPDLSRPYRAIGYPVLPGIALAVNIVLLGLFLASDRVGSVYAVILWLACIPFAYIARRAQKAG